MSQQTHIYFRADGSSHMGLGHIHRSLALASMVADTFVCTFVTRNPLPALKTMITDVCQDCIDLGDIDPAQEAEHIAQSILTNQDIVVLDGYHFDLPYQQAIARTGCKIVCLDDIHRYHFLAHAVINHAGGIDSSLYSAEPYTRFYLGPRYTLLKKPFLEAARHRHETPAGNALFICLGGADPGNQTRFVLEKCLPHNFDEYIVVVGAAYQHSASLQAFAAQHGAIRILSNLSAEEMVTYMQRCRTAVCSPSGVAYEYLCAGGALYLHQTADNQDDLCNYLLRASLAFVFADFPTVPATIVAHAIVEQAKIFDGRSNQRLAKIFLSLEYDLHATLRRATEADVDVTYAWANDPETRSQSFQSDAIPYSNHKNWFLRKVATGATYYYIVVYKQQPVAQIRFDLAEGEALISYGIDAAYRSKGLGTWVLQRGIEQFRKDHAQPVCIIGYVKASNEKSNTIFRNMGFTQVPTEEKYKDAFKYKL
ncbi:UDP-2,4-diacetamido-2,4,6-trideoxy-beta-L-altropyranose hydrolase [Parachryseolinea silvisoli]|uniref:UDP-2,4-diacetamido-2,4, 6-trideoxy-beta-L-altropyranose hydrolase n=1 Tax=Parachryseolinea silvisoli TaxID=2873601 RepID=UPI00226591CB|nr:UDP-2,4-diacetamido-2,4,6-trideoxy-beta-L-altropyranose hydrolase [Parachryseolinea silvisoli]MCD9019625.1 UDP-2,4-diacetamido-2,4,6-trideoxy-beta-L-altropyranose hydrolase [Parachryseolinea silvisoli]